MCPLFSETSVTQKIKSFALDVAGFDLVGVTKANLPLSQETALSQWLQKGYAGSMEYMKRDPERRAHPERSLSDAKTVIALALNYHHPEDVRPDSTPTGKVAKYAYGADYHKLIEKKLKIFSKYILDLGPSGTQVKGYVDTGPILERAFARQAGLGFIGKNTNLISRDFGSWIFLACLITNLPLEEDPVHQGSCGSCQICLDACPTQALLGNYVLDATRCISYWTIEAKEPPSPDLEAKFQDWVFGCDICQDVCPYNFRAKTTKNPELYPEKKAGTWLSLDSLEIQPQSPLKRSKFLGRYLPKR